MIERKLKLQFSENSRYYYSDEAQEITSSSGSSEYVKVIFKSDYDSEQYFKCARKFSVLLRAPYFGRKPRREDEHIEFYHDVSDLIRGWRMIGYTIVGGKHVPMSEFERMRQFFPAPSAL